MKYKTIEFEDKEYQVPYIDNLCQTVWKAVQVEGAYNQKRFHGDMNGNNCNTMHCFAGHIIHALGRSGYELAGAVPLFRANEAAAMIFEASTGAEIDNCWFDGNADPTKVLAEIKRLAEEEACQNKQ